MSLIRIATAGSVDDGKSTLIGRLLWETDSLLEDQVAALKEASERRGEELQLALVTDGLRAEREQNITIDVAYRPFHGSKHRYVIADSPGHVQYTRNMVTGTSTADAVIVLADAQRGLQTQSMRHLAVACLLRVPTIIIAVNKMDLVAYDQKVFEAIVERLEAFASQFGEVNTIPIPVSALIGDNVTSRSSRMAWYEGPSILELLDSLEPGESPTLPATMPVQNVLLGPDQLRYYAGTVHGDRLPIGTQVETSGGQKAKVAGVVSMGERADCAEPGVPSAIQLDRELDICRGDWLMAGKEALQRGRRIQATVFWMLDEPLRIGLPYALRQGPRVNYGKVTKIASLLDLESGRYEPSNVLALNDIGLVEIELTNEAPLALYEQSRDLGSFILVDPQHQTAAGGIINSTIESPQGARDNDGIAFWLTGLSGAGKTTIAEAFIQKLTEQGTPCVHLDGDSLRSGLCSDLGFSDEDRNENIRRMAEVAKLFASRGIVAVCSLISPLNSHRAMARSILDGYFCEVYVQCDLDECIRRDPKGLYAKALEGTIAKFTGISAPYEEPVAADTVLSTQSQSLSDCVGKLESRLRRMKQGEGNHGR